MKRRQGEDEGASDVVILMKVVPLSVMMVMKVVPLSVM